MILTKHAKLRYRERFGVQDDKEIIRRAQVAVVSKHNDDNTEQRRYGAIIFEICGDTIMTVKKKNI